MFVQNKKKCILRLYSTQYSYLVLKVIRNHYDLLGVGRTADFAQIHAAFRSLSKTLHPDTTSLPPDEAASQFRKLCEAYELLADPERRRIYDSDLIDLELTPEDSFEQVTLHQGGKDLHLKERIVNVRRPFSGGELFALLLLVISICLSLFSVSLNFSSSS